MITIEESLAEDNIEYNNVLEKLETTEPNNIPLTIKEWDEIQYLSREDKFLDSLVNGKNRLSFNTNWCNIVIARWKLEKWKEEKLQ